MTGVPLSTVPDRGQSISSSSDIRLHKWEIADNYRSEIGRLEKQVAVVVFAVGRFANATQFEGVVIMPGPKRMVAGFLPLRMNDI